MGYRYPLTQACVDSCLGVFFFLFCPCSSQKSTSGEVRDAREQQLRAVQFQAMRQSARRQIARTLRATEKEERVRLGVGVSEQGQQHQDAVRGKPRGEMELELDHALRALGGRTVRPVNREEGEGGKKARDLRAATFQRTDSLKRRLLRFEGELQDRRPDLDLDLDGGHPYPSGVVGKEERDTT